MRGLPRATSIAVWVAALTQVLVAAADWRDYAVFRDDVASWNPGTGRAIDVVLFVPTIVAAVVFVVWLWRARTASEAISPWFPHRHERGWVIAGWIVPVIFFWFPLHIVEDVITASTPQAQPGEAEPQPSSTNVVYLWWGTWIATTFVDTFPVGPDDEPTADDFLVGALASTATLVLSIVCAVYAVRVIRLITDLQSLRPADELAPGLPPYQH